MSYFNFQSEKVRKSHMHFFGTFLSLRKFLENIIIEILMYVY